MALAKAEHSETFEAGFTFARHLRNPEFRALLERHQWTPGQHVVVATSQEPILDVIARMMLHDTGPRAFIAIVDHASAFGFRFMTVEVVPAQSDHPNLIELGPGASIGMLYSTLEPCGTYVPSTWTAPLLFERVIRPV